MLGSVEDKKPRSPTKQCTPSVAYEINMEKNTASSNKSPMAKQVWGHCTFFPPFGDCQCSLTY